MARPVVTFVFLALVSFLSCSVESRLTYAWSADQCGRRLLLGDGCCQGSVRLTLSINQHDFAHNCSTARGTYLGSPNNSSVIAEWQDAGGPAGPPRLIAPRHVHYRDDEAWYVLEGTLRVQAGENEIEARAGSPFLCSARHAAHVLESWSRLPAPSLITIQVS